MKDKIMALLMVFAAVSVAVTGCNKVEGQVPVAKNYVANLTGAEETPPVVTPATGQATFTLSADGTSMAYTINVSNIDSPTAAHIHVAALGIAGPVAVPLFGAPKVGPFTGVLIQGTITQAIFGGPLLGMTMADLVTAIELGNTYVNVHTTAHPGGEIRGQIHLGP